MLGLSWFVGVFLAFQCGASELRAVSLHREQDVLKVAVVCPTLALDGRTAESAKDAKAGWDLWLDASKRRVTVAGREVSVESTLLEFGQTKPLLTDVKKAIVDGGYHAVVHCSTHHSEEVAREMQELKVPNLHCNSGSDAVWKALAKEAGSSQLYGFSMHAPVSSYPDVFFQQAKKSIGDRSPNPSVVLVLGEENRFTRNLCEAAAVSATKHGMIVIQPKDGSKFFKLPDQLGHGDLYEELRHGRAEVLYGCTMQEDGSRLMQLLESSPKRPMATSISVDPSKEASWVKEFSSGGAWVSFPAQWHAHGNKHSCGSSHNEGEERVDDAAKCEPVFSSVLEFEEANERAGFEGAPSYDKASCAAAGLALQAAARELPRVFFGEPLDSQRETLVAKLKSVDIDSFYGPIRFSSDMHMNKAKKPMNIQWVPDGRGSIVATRVGLAGLYLGADQDAVARQMPQGDDAGAWFRRAQNELGQSMETEVGGTTHLLKSQKSHAAPLMGLVTISLSLVFGALPLFA